MFHIIDEIIEDLKDDHNKIRCANRLGGLRNSSRRNQSQEMYLSWIRIINRFYDNDIAGTTEMLRELQDDIVVWSGLGYSEYRTEYRTAWYRFVDWRLNSIKG